MNSFFALLFRQKYVHRWGLMRSSTAETLSEHTAETAAIAHSLAIIGNTLFNKSYNVERIVCHALYHDATEVLTGDMPTPVKYFSPEMRNNYALIEKQAAENLISRLPEELRQSYSSLLCSDADPDTERIVKIADKLSAYIKCITEVTVGNREFESARISTLESLKKYKCEELDYFMEHFIEAFTHTLDEL